MKLSRMRNLCREPAGWSAHSGVMSSQVIFSIRFQVFVGFNPTATPMVSSNAGPLGYSILVLTHPFVSRLAER